MLEFVINPEDPASGKRTVPFGGELWIERDDFAALPPKGFHRLSPASEVRLRWAYFITCTSFETDSAGNVTLVRCTYDPATRGGDAPTGPDGQPTKKVKGTLHWLSAHHCVDADVRLFERLFTAEEPGLRTGNFADDLNPKSLEVVAGKVESHLAHAKPGERFQFERLGYFCVDRDRAAGKLVFNRTVTLKDSFAPSDKPKPAPSGKTYSLGQTAHTLKLSKDALPALLEQAGVATLAASRDPAHLTQDEFDKVRKLVSKK